MNLKRKIKIKKEYILVLHKIPWILARNAFRFFLIFFIIVLITVGFVFYKNVWLVQQRDIEVEIKKVQINEKIYNEFINNYHQREVKRLSAEDEKYIDIFFER